MNLPGLTPRVSSGSLRGQRIYGRAAIRPQIAALEVLKTLRFAPGLAHPRPYGRGFRLRSYKLYNFTNLINSLKQTHFLLDFQKRLAGRSLRLARALGQNVYQRVFISHQGQFFFAETRKVLADVFS